jgi:hypothetical protein
MIKEVLQIQLRGWFHSAMLLRHSQQVSLPGHITPRVV